MKPTKPRKKKLPKASQAEVLVFGKDYLSTVEEMLHSMSIGIGPRDRKKYVNLLIASMREINQEDCTLH